MALAAILGQEQKWHPVTATDTLSQSDSAAAQHGVARTASDSLSFSDVALPANAQDHLAFADSTQTVKTFARSLADSLSFTDSATGNAHNLARSATDSFAFQETLSRALGFTRTLNDSAIYILLQWTASVSPGVIQYNIYRSLVSNGPYTLIGSVNSSTTSFKDTNVAGLTNYFYVVTSYNGSIESQLSNQAQASAIFTELVNVGTGKSAVDTATFSDSVKVKNVESRSATDTLTFSETAAPGHSVSSTASDSFSLSESFLKGSGRVPTDTVSFSDSATAAKNAPTVSDTESFAESAAHTVALPRTASDTESQSDSVSRQLAGSKSATDTLAESDSATKNSSVHVAPTDTFPFSDRAQGNNATDSFSFSDSVARGIGRTASDSLSFSDSAGKQTGFSRNAADNPSFSDAATRQPAPFDRTASDQETFIDVAITHGAIVIVVDTENFSDSASAGHFQAGAATDTQSFSESASAVAQTVLSRAGFNSFRSGYPGAMGGYPTMGNHYDLWYDVQTGNLYMAVTLAESYLPAQDDAMDFTNIYRTPVPMNVLQGPAVRLPRAAPVGTIFLVNDTLQAFAGTGIGLQRFNLDVTRALRANPPTF